MTVLASTVEAAATVFFRSFYDEVAYCTDLPPSQSTSDMPSLPSRDQAPSLKPVPLAAVVYSVSCTFTDVAAYARGLSRRSCAHVDVPECRSLSWNFPELK